MMGTFIDVAAILAGGIAGLATSKEIPVHRQNQLKNFIGIFAVWFGLSLAWFSLKGGFWSILFQVFIIISGMILGKITGRLFGIQRRLNKLGRYAKNRYEKTDPANKMEGFPICALLFCLGPLAIYGALQDGLYGNFRALILKSIMDGLAAMAFARVFGPSVLLSGLPVLAYQGTLTLLAQWVEPYLRTHDILDITGATLGLLIYAVSLVIMDLKRLDLADYVPSLFWAPLLSWLLR
jgi:uncharacterized membrane protein YqgA involved in biofilm formation